MNNKRIYVVSASALVAVLGSVSAPALEFEVRDTSVDIYGYARLNMAYNFDGDAGSANEGYFAEAATTPDSPDGDFQISASQSRFGFATVTPTRAGDISTKFEGDFWSENDTNPRFRLRQAYGEWNGILGGQTWSNYNTFVGFTPTLDFYGTAASAGYGSRVPQLRYTTGHFSVALEKPLQNIVEGEEIPADVSAGDAVTSLPTLSVRYEESSGVFSYALAGVLRQLKYDTNSQDDTALGGAVLAAASYTQGPLTVRGIAHASEGGNYYLYWSGGYWNGADAFIDQGGSLNKLSGEGASIGFSYKLSPEYTLNTSYGYTRVASDGVQVAAAEAFESDFGRKNQNAFVNLMWTPHERLMYGLEFAYYKTQVQDQIDEDAKRLMLSAQYAF
ncbi:DcaP family trimeric outer membrane transporter [Halomonas faecis]|uniref:DcaP family trimeric outer membrane transporter n=1 Tax=Halomonas faecis TaxID=1562110 RepID=UPI0013D11730|nr:DcaP family trimeric outer membrane transporter [Halomonas faecis]